MSSIWDAEFEHIVRQALRLLPHDEPLLPDLDAAKAGLDSLATVELLLTIEDTYGIFMPDELLQRQTFLTPGALWKVVEGLRGSADPEEGGA